VGEGGLLWGGLTWPFPFSKEYIQIQFEDERMERTLIPKHQVKPQRSPLSLRQTDDQLRFSKSGTSTQKDPKTQLSSRKFKSYFFYFNN
jgi:hypothetical protein